jgi:carboxymethylenebutenolidase
MNPLPRDPTIDFDPGVWKLFDEYVHGVIDRRAFLRGASQYAVGAMTASAMLALLSPRFAEAQQVAPEDARIRAEYVEFDSPAGYGRGRGYLVRPAEGDGPAPMVLVAHENRGLNPHIEDVARRLALAGFIAFAPDALFPLGGYPGNEDAARAEFAKLDQAKTRADFLAAAQWLRAQDGGNGKLGVVGFCWGGGISHWLATQLPDLAAAAPYYGMGAPLEAVPSIQAELLIVLAENDERINAGWPAYEDALKAAGVRYRLLQPKGTQHGFHNDTTPRYHPEAAAEVWKQTLELFERRLR